jgi:hypothetical protein
MDYVKQKITMAREEIMEIMDSPIWEDYPGLCSRRVLTAEYRVLYSEDS